MWGKVPFFYPINIGAAGFLGLPRKPFLHFGVINGLVYKQKSPDHCSEVVLAQKLNMTIRLFIVCIEGKGNLVHRRQIRLPF